MIALIEIPHQRPAKLHWYDDAHQLIRTAEATAENDGRDIDDHGFSRMVDNAAHELADDWASHLLVESAAGVEAVRAYCCGDGRPGGHRHKAAEVAALLPELEEHFTRNYELELSRRDEETALDRSAAETARETDGRPVPPTTLLDSCKEMLAVLGRMPVVDPLISEAHTACKRARAAIAAATGEKI